MTASVSSTDSDSAADLFQNSFYVGVNLENILYGIALLLYFKTMRILLTSGKARKKSNAFYALFSSSILFLVTIWVAGQAYFGEKMWILEDDYPGGSEEYYKKNIFVWYVDWGTTAVILLQLMTDGLMIYRCRMIWGSYYAVVLPVLLWFACLALGIIVDWTTSSPGGDFFSGFGAQVGFVYYTVAVVLNTTLTCMICYRIVRYGRNVQDRLGPDYASLYYTIATLFVESVFPYTIAGIAFLVSLGMGSPTSVAFVSVYFLMMCISPQMLILRVIVGRAVNEQTFKPPNTSLEFQVGETGSAAVATTDGNGTKTQLQTLPDVYLRDSKV